MPGQQRVLSFLWWNLHNFAHFDGAKISAPRWPKQLSDFETKKVRILSALHEMFGSEFPDLLAVCEITREAAKDLAGKLPGFEVVVPPHYPRDDGFQVAVFFRSGFGFTPEPPILPFEREDVTEETRPMIPVHFELPGHVIRFVACHWTSFDMETSRVSRERLADVLRRDTHEFLHPEASQTALLRHVVILGDLNAEPMSPIFEERLIGSRDRASSQREHWRDEQVRRVRLYNAAWRYLGEQNPHGDPGANRGAAGTFYNPDLRWRTFDHLFVSGELLRETRPYLDEAKTGIRYTPVMVDGDGWPKPFEPDSTSGVSDHLPIVGQIVLPENKP
jgi:endonuclease/exonuclease/phosphatase family metal-dependent hydrolase